MSGDKTDRLMPPVCPDDGIEHEVRPKAENAKRVRIDRAVEQLRQRIVRDTQGEKREPHADRVLHVEALHSNRS
jgi:hypothetical protein